MCFMEDSVGNFMSLMEDSDGCLCEPHKLYDLVGGFCEPQGGFIWSFCEPHIGISWRFLWTQLDLFPATNSKTATQHQKVSKSVDS